MLAVELREISNVKVNDITQHEIETTRENGARVKVDLGFWFYFLVLPTIVCTYHFHWETTLPLVVVCAYIITNSPNCASTCLISWKEALIFWLSLINVVRYRSKALIIFEMFNKNPPLCVGNNTKKSGLYKYVLRHTSSSSSPRHRDGEEGSRPREFVMAPKAYTKCYYYLSFLFVLIYVSIHKESALSFFFCGGVGGDAFELILCGPQSGQMRPSFRVVVQFKCRGRERIIAHWTCFQFTWPRKRVSPFYVVWRWRVVFPFPKVTWLAYCVYLAA